MNVMATVPAVRLDDVSTAVLALLKEIGRPAIVHDPATGLESPVSHEELARSDGYLPVIVVAAEALWLDLTGTGFALEIRESADATLGYALNAIRAGSWSALMLCVIDAFESLPVSDGPIRLVDFVDLWGDARSRLRTVPVQIQEEG
ncbi:hypothetical protein J2D73_10145 [Acetobacter sacchari]|uniref:Uncharacterized protein n=1 Tax=Acetobacter sacchari TaxID=2661687 RepID=A0ABS3LW86_9PROT|nr:hypothetical protein [Acetobacter sacchari]MBO1360158.1 hypothetical protein [Acetobacter sacchari]